MPKLTTFAPCALSAVQWGDGCGDCKMRTRWSVGVLLVPLALGAAVLLVAAWMDGRVPPMPQWMDAHLGWQVAGTVLLTLSGCFAWRESARVRELSRTVSLLRAAERAIPFAMVFYGRTGRIRRLNPAAERLFGWRADELAGRHTALVLHDRDELLRVAREAGAADGGPSLDVVVGPARDGAIATREWTMVRRDGSRFAGLVTVLALPDQAGVARGFLAIVQDLTERKQTDRELADTRHLAAAAARTKAAFLANMSHELRTPMNAIIGFTDLLLETELDPEQRDFAQTVRRSGHALLAIINDVLDLSKIEAGHVALERRPVDVRACVDEALDRVASAARTKGLAVERRIDGDVPATLQADAARLRQVLGELVGNAVKFTERGAVRVHVRRAVGGAARLCFEVVDTGIGIPSDRVDDLFDCFVQADGSSTRRYGGTGLGLAISQRLAHLMGGDIACESVPGRGSTFRLSLPVDAACPDVAADAARLRGFPGLRVLLATADASAAGLATRLLAAWGVGVETVADADQALARLRQSEPDVVILDAELPGLAREALSGWLQGRRDVGGRLIVVEGSRGPGPGAGLPPADATVRRSMDAGALHRAIATSMAAAAARAKPSTDPPRGPLRILIAEDNPVNQRVAQAMLGRLGHRAVVAGNGAEAIEAVAREQFDVVLMDLQMPEVDGLAATREIRRRWPGPAAPAIVAVTASTLAEDRAACVAVGMDDFLSKPVALEALRTVLERVTRARDAAPAAGGDARGLQPAGTSC